MSYTVKQLAKLSGVSSRTLRFYDEINLLKPGYYGENNYRYYEEEQLLMLQQILFYRELGFRLSDIQRIINNDDFNTIEALESHKNILKQDLNRKENLIKTIDKTIARIRGNTKMKDEELYYGFDSKKQKQHEKYLVEKGILTQEFLNECNAKVKNWSDKEKNVFIHDIERIMNALIMAIDKKLLPSSEEVQNLLHEHYIWLKRTWTPTKESYTGLIQLYQTPEFRKFYDDRHPELFKFMINAMQIYANEKL
ncbi:MAG: MerR family transcriptional regulator [Legionella sp.]|nr:MerR family transcriptional regulator [Legionella sp.]